MAAGIPLTICIAIVYRAPSAAPSSLLRPAGLVVPTAWVFCCLPVTSAIPLPCAIHCHLTRGPTDATLPAAIRIITCISISTGIGCPIPTCSLNAPRAYGHWRCLHDPIRQGVPRGWPSYLLPILPLHPLIQHGGHGV